MNPKNADEAISKIDSVIRVLSKSAPRGSFLDQDDINALDKVEYEDKPKLADRLADLIVILKEEPDNKRKILEAHDATMDKFGHIKPVFDALNSVKELFLT